MTADGYVSSDPKNVYALVITATGASAGDKIVLRDGGPTGTIKAQFELPDTKGIWSIEFGRYGVEFGTSVYYSEQAAAPNTIKSTIVFD